MYALVNMGMADAFISCWEAKYKYNLLRPQTYIRNYISNATSWKPLIGTPPFPEYPSGHSVASGVAASILTSLFGNVAFTDNTNISVGIPARSYKSFTEAANEAAISRLYGGIHYREACENGVKQGELVASSVMKHIKLKR
jgi:membrane-associated phospholipid phosphatase